MQINKGHLFFFCYLCVGVLLVSTPIFAQGEIAEEGQVLFFSEQTFGASLTSKGISADYRYAKDINVFKKSLYTIELAHLKDPKERKDAGTANSRSFVYGKMNSFYVFRFGAGLQKEKFNKQDKGSISIRYYYTGNLNIGIKKPVYYEYYQKKDTIEQIVVKKYEDEHANTLLGRAGFFNGLGELKFVPGVSVKAGATFEFKDNPKRLQALEVGVVADVFPQKIRMIYKAESSFYFVSIFVNYRFGKVTERRSISKKNRIDRFIQN
ncbi:hypothetical protein OAO55_02310 [Bacteroidales bacterium]|nr:hypothetical protein [Bacteroidales bacterium]